MDEFEKQREMFELWVVKQFPGQFREDVLRKDDTDGAYVDLLVSHLFVGFCAGWELSR